MPRPGSSSRRADCRGTCARSRLSRPLHFGDYGGLPLKIIWALLDLAAILVLASGVYLWLGKRRPSRNMAQVPSPSAAVTSLAGS